MCDLDRVAGICGKQQDEGRRKERSAAVESPACQADHADEQRADDHIPQRIEEFNQDGARELPARS